MPVLNKLEKNPNISQVLVTSNTLSSSKIIEKYKFKKLVHQFFPIDTNFFSNKFLNYWKPSTAFFIDSEIWPNTIDNLKKKNIPIILLNGRITKKTFTKWKLLSNFAKNIFSKFNLCLASSNKSKNYLTILGAKKVKMIGNLKYSQLEDEKNFLSENIKKDLHSKKIWCASSTHESEETFCGLIHKRLKKKYKNLLTIIIPRHIERVDSIQKDLLKLNLKVQTHEPQKKIRSDTDIYIVNSYGKTKSFYNICKNVFLGGSLINHGGQNPLEAARFGCNILHWPNVSNFEEIYKLLSKYKIAEQITSEINLFQKLKTDFDKKIKIKNENAIKNINQLGEKILENTFQQLKGFIKK